MQVSKYEVLNDLEVEEIVEATQFREYETIEELLGWLGAQADVIPRDDDGALVISIPNNDTNVNQLAVLGDWFVKHADNVYVTSQEDFTHFYKPVGAPEPVVEETIVLFNPIETVKGE